MACKKYKVKQGDKVLGHFTGHSFQEAYQKAIDTQNKYGNHFNENEPFYLFRGSNKYKVYLDGREVIE